MLFRVNSSLSTGERIFLGVVVLIHTGLVLWAIGGRTIQAVQGNLARLLQLPELVRRFSRPAFSRAACIPVFVLLRK